MSIKFAKVSCSLGLQELDLFYYNVECDQLTKWAESDRDQKDQRIKEVARVFTTGLGTITSQYLISVILNDINSSVVDNEL